jgi:RING-H2 zinc finger domain
MIFWSFGIVVFAVVSCFMVEWIWLKLFFAGVILHRSVLSPYRTLQGERLLRRQRIEQVMLLTLPPDDSNRLNDVCAICMTPMEQLHARMTSCSHIYHINCLVKWFDVKLTCPTCQKAIAVDDYYQAEEIVADDEN